MKRRNFMVNLLLWVVAFFFGYTVTKKDEPLRLSTQLAEIAKNVKSFGATGDGINDDSEAVQTAVDSLGTNGGTILLPAPAVEYYFSQPVVLKDNVRVIGVGKGCFVTTKGNYPAFISPGVNNATKGITEVSIENLFFRDHSTVYKDKYTIELANAFNCKIENITIDVNERTQAEVAGIYFSWKKGYNGNCFVNKVHNCQLRGASIVVESTDSIVTNSEIWGNSRSFAVHFVKSSQVLSNSQIVGSSVNGGLWIEDTKDHSNVETIKVCNNFFDGSYDSVDSGCGIYAKGLISSTIISNTFWRQMDEGAHLLNGFSNTITGNTFKNCNRRDAGKSDIKIEAPANVVGMNTFHRDYNHNNKGKPLEIINGYVDKNTVVGNRVYDTSFYIPSSLDDPTAGGINY